MAEKERKLFILKKRRKGLTEMNNKTAIDAAINKFADDQLVISKRRRAGFSAIPYDRSENEEEN
jgi:hypothetical protein